MGAGALCGLWVDDTGRAHVARASPEGRRVVSTEDFQPFAWTTEVTSHPGVGFETLTGEGPYRHLAHAETMPAFEAFLDAVRECGGVDYLRPYESQWLLQRRERLFAGLRFADLRRCQLDIETAADDGGRFSDPQRPTDHVLAIGLALGDRIEILELEEETPAGEKRLLLRFADVLRELDPDVVEGHNIFKFDLDYLRQRCRRHKVPCAWGRFGRNAAFRPGRLRVAERWIDFPRCDLPGRAVVDTYLLVQLHDLASREMTSYGLKEAAVHLGITPEKGEGRTYLPGAEIASTFRKDRERFRAYLADDLRETRGLGDRLLPTYFEQARTFPLPLQDASLRGSAAKVDLLFLEEYYHARAACAAPGAVAPFEGGFTRSFQEGVFRHVLHFDVASLYPSLLLHLGRNPRSDPLGVFIPLLRRLRDYRLRYKQLAREAPSAAERDEAQARQAAFKILINSFYGYLGFPAARFGDAALAAEVTRLGRELLQRLIAEFERLGCLILEADTDGIYLSSGTHFGAPERLLAAGRPILPADIELEFDGRYDAMFCYKAKNYALAVDGEIILRGSALRSRGTEPYLRRLTDALISQLLGGGPPVTTVLAELRRGLAARTVPVADLARMEFLGQSPEAYAQAVISGGKPRRAAGEVALRLEPRPRLGERVSYFIAPARPGETADWQRARPIAAYDAEKNPYDPAYYLGKVEDWVQRYGRFAGLRPSSEQQELAF